MNRYFGRTFKMVAAVHIGVAVVSLTVSGFSGCFKDKAEMNIPIEFMVMAPSEAHAAAEEAPVPDAVVPPVQKKETVSLPEKPPKPKEPKPAKPKQKLRKPSEIKVNNRRAVRNPTAAPPKSKLSEAEIARRLAMGAKMGPRDTAIPDEDSRCNQLLRDAFYAPWVAPAKELVGDITAEVEITLDGAGNVMSWRLVKRSGNETMDTSVQQAASTVRHVPELTAGYLRRNRTNTIVFRSK